MKTLLHSPQARQQVRANLVLARLAELLFVDTDEEILRAGEVPVVFALYRGWRLEVYVELGENQRESSPWSWVLILSRGDLRGFRLFSREEVRSAAHHVHRFVEEPSYRRRWFR